MIMFKLILVGFKKKKKLGPGFQNFILKWSKQNRNLNFIYNFVLGAFWGFI